MTDYEEAEPVVLEGEIVEELTPAQKRMQYAREQKGISKPVPKKAQRINVTKIMAEHGYCPVTSLILMAQNRWEDLGLQKPVSAHEMNSSAQCLLHISVPGIKPVDYINPDETIKKIPVFTGVRELPTRSLPAEPTSFLDYNEET